VYHPGKRQMSHRGRVRKPQCLQSGHSRGLLQGFRWSPSSRRPASAPAVRAREPFGPANVRQLKDRLARGCVPEGDRSAFATQSEPLTVRRERQRRDGVGVTAQHKSLVAPATLPEVATFPAAEILLAGAGALRFKQGYGVPNSPRSSAACARSMSARRRFAGRTAHSLRQSAVAFRPAANR